MDTALTLTRGSPVGQWAVLGRLRAGKAAILPLRLGGGQPPMIGQILYNSGERAARITYLPPIRALES